MVRARWAFIWPASEASTLAALILSQETRATNLDTMEQEAAAVAAIEATSP